MNNFRRNLINAIILSLSVIVLLFLISLLKEGKKIFDFNLNFNFIFFSFCLVILIWIVEVFRLKILLKFLNINLSFLYLLYTHFVSYFFSSITPMGLGGFMAKVYLISKKRDFDIGYIVSILTFLYLFNMFIYLLISVSLLFLFKYLTINFKFGERLFLFLLIFIFLLSLIIFLVIVKPQVFRKIAHKILNSFKKINQEKRERIQKLIDDNFLRFVDGMKRAIDLKFKIIPIFLLSILSFILLNSLSYFLIRALGVNIGFFNSFLLQFIYHFFAGWSITPGGSGISEALFSTLFLSQVGLSKILTLVVLFKIFTYYIYIIVGGALSIKELSEFLEIKKIYEKRRDY